MLSHHLLNTLLAPQSWRRHRHHTCVIITSQIGEERFLYVKNYAYPAIGAWHAHRVHRLLEQGQLPYSSVSVIRKTPSQLVLHLRHNEIYLTSRQFMTLNDYQAALQAKLTNENKQLD
ncbi:hypothetical protein LMC02_09830 [Limosilactobacillus reuteri]|uniref:hypothetical protein n=1 Tax=Limosilactobacillus reuteri TaxID=1598 RepID=UPI001E4AEEAA|nr:hypothetical protein [Limosilactobacillus reuteri]MCC4500286.1 hypothetical protein [Limosilactobacillus reuteri]MCC4500611.1 hypothetical protein [Limosilactobacillus reuteri]